MYIDITDEANNNSVVFILVIVIGNVDNINIPVNSPITDTLDINNIITDSIILIANIPLYLKNHF